jgi:putative transcriptional regulator
MKLVLQHRQLNSCHLERSEESITPVCGIGRCAPDGSSNHMKNRLRVLRAERGWSQADLAAQLGVSRQTVNAIETGKYDPSLPLAFKIAKLFRAQIEQIFEEGQPPAKA